MWKPVSLFAQQINRLVSVWGNTGAVNGLISRGHFSQLSRTSLALPGKERKKEKKKKITHTDSLKSPTPEAAKVC